MEVEKDSEKRVKVAIAFYGLTRSLKLTIDSIKSKIFKVLEEGKYDYDIFLHTYSLNTTYINKRAKENVASNKIDNQEYKLLNPDYLKIDNQQKIKKKLNLKAYRRNRDPWNTNYSSVDNYILGSYSKLQVTKLIETSGNDYQYVMFVRPDCLYLDTLSLQYLEDAKTFIVMPNFHLCGKFKINDRFAITNKNNYQVYGKIFNRLLAMSRRRPLHSETILGIILKPYKIKKVKFRFARIRMGGRRHFRDKFK